MSNSSVTTYCEEANENWNSHLVLHELRCLGTAYLDLGLTIGLRCEELKLFEQHYALLG